MTEVPVGISERRGERRLPMAAAVLVDGLLYLLLPAQFRVSDLGAFAYPAFLLILVILIMGDPGRINRETRWLRAATGVMIGAMTVATAASAVRLVVLISGARDPQRNRAAAGHRRDYLGHGGHCVRTLVLASRLRRTGGPRSFLVPGDAGLPLS